MSLINQTYPKDKYEIIIADGKSEDGTLDVIRKFQDKYIKEGLVITVVTNEKKILATGWNIAINAAKGEYVTRIDAHAEAEPDFVENSIKAILKVDAVCVGGKLTSLSLDGAENVISKVRLLRSEWETHHFACQVKHVMQILQCTVCIRRVCLKRLDILMRRW